MAFERSTPSDRIRRPPVSACEQDFENEKREGRFVQAFPSIYFVNANHPAGGTVDDFKR
jgi:hypothetical protein